MKPKKEIVIVIDKNKKYPTFKEEILAISRRYDYLEPKEAKIVFSSEKLPNPPSGEGVE